MDSNGGASIVERITRGTAAAAAQGNGADDRSESTLSGKRRPLAGDVEDGDDRNGPSSPSSSTHASRNADQKSASSARGKMVVDPNEWKEMEEMKKKFREYKKKVENMEMVVGASGEEFDSRVKQWSNKETSAFSDSLRKAVKQIVDMLPSLSMDDRETFESILDDMNSVLDNPDDLRQVSTQKRLKPFISVINVKAGSLTARERKNGGGKGRESRRGNDVEGDGDDDDARADSSLNDEDNGGGGKRYQKQRNLKNGRRPVDSDDDDNDNGRRQNNTNKPTGSARAPKRHRDDDDVSDDAKESESNARSRKRNSAMRHYPDNDDQDQEDARSSAAAKRRGKRKALDSDDDDDDNNNDDGGRTRHDQRVNINDAQEGLKRKKAMYEEEAMKRNYDSMGGRGSSAKLIHTVASRNAGRQRDGSAYSEVSAYYEGFKPVDTHLRDMGYERVHVSGLTTRYGMPADSRLLRLNMGSWNQGAIKRMKDHSENNA